MSSLRTHALQALRDAAVYVTGPSLMPSTLGKSSPKFVPRSSSFYRMFWHMLPSVGGRG